MEFFRSFWTSTRHYLANEAITGVLSLLGLLVFTRILAPEEYGYYSLAIALGGLGLTLSVEWVQVSILRFFPARSLRRNQAAVSAAAWTATLLGLAGFTILLSLGYLFTKTSAGRTVILAGWLYTLLGAFFMVGTTFLQASQRARLFMRFRSALAVLRVLLSLVFLLAVHRGWISLIAGFLAAFIILNLPLAGKQTRPASPGASRSRASLRSLARFGLPLLGWFLAGQLLNLSDRFLIQWLAGPESVGLYSLSYALVAGVLAMVLQPPLAAAYPLLVESLTKEGGGETSRRLGAILGMIILAIPPLFLGLSFFGRDLMLLMIDADYMTESRLLLVLALGLCIWQGSLYLQKMLELEKKTRRLFLFAGLAALLNILLNLVLIPRLGIMGAALATLLAYALYLGLLLGNLRGRIAVILPPGRWTAALLGSLVFAIIAFLPQLLLPELSPAIRLFVFGVPALGAYLALLAWRGIFRGSRATRGEG